MFIKNKDVDNAMNQIKLDVMTELSALVIKSVNRNNTRVDLSAKN